MKKILFPALALTFTALLFTHPALAAAGCSLGLNLWYSSVLPSLLPFFIVSNLLVRTGLFRYLNRIYAPLVRRIFHISDEGCYAVVIGFLCGFPMGAKVIGDLVRDERISRQEGAYLLGFCNNVSPAFFLNYACLRKLGYLRVPWMLAGIFYLTPVLYGLFSRPFYHFVSSGQTKKQASLQRLNFPMLDACIMDSFATVVRLGGYIILFAIFTQMLRLLPLRTHTLAFLCALLEISCGVHELSALTVHASLIRTALVCACASFGGLCIFAQTQSVLEGSNLSAIVWLRGRLFITPAAFLLALLPAAAPVLAGCW